MKIAVDIKGAYSYHGTGIGTYTEKFIENLINLDKSNVYELLYCGTNPSNFKNPNTNVHLISRKHSSFFEQKYIPNLLKNKNCLIFHAPQNGIGYKDLFSENKFKTIVTIHDLIPYVLPQTVGKSYLKNFLKQIPYVIEKSSSIITVSNCSKKEILKFFPIDPNKISVIHLAADEIFKPINFNFAKSFVKEKYNIDYNFILYIGGFSKRKNIYNLISAFEKAYKNFNKPIKLLLLGNIKGENEILQNLISQKNLEKHIKFIGFVPEKDLPMFYNASIFFVYISLYEGFGLPVLEAMSCKKAVLSSNIPSILEITNKNSYFVDPNDIIKISEGLCEISNNENLRISLEEKSFNQSKNFSWEKCAKETLKIYESINQNNF